MIVCAWLLFGMPLFVYVDSRWYCVVASYVVLYVRVRYWLPLCARGWYVIVCVLECYALVCLWLFVCARRCSCLSWFVLVYGVLVFVFVCLCFSCLCLVGLGCYRLLVFVRVC